MLECCLPCELWFCRFGTSSTYMLNLAVATTWHDMLHHGHGGGLVHGCLLVQNVVLLSEMVCCMSFL